jgi:hypothetical protein
MHINTWDRRHLYTVKNHVRRDTEEESSRIKEKIHENFDEEKIRKIFLRWYIVHSESSSSMDRRLIQNISCMDRISKMDKLAKYGRIITGL